MIERAKLYLASILLATSVSADSITFDPWLSLGVANDNSTSETATITENGLINAQGKWELSLPAMAATSTPFTHTHFRVMKVSAMLTCHNLLKKTLI